MRLVLLYLISSLIYGVSCKNNVKSLTESLGQEVIEIGDPIKGLPPDIDEEPSAEVDDDDKVSTTSQSSPGTKRDVKKTTTLDTRRRGKDIDKIDNNQEDEEARIEKELAEIYKDTDYKEGVAEPLKEIANYTEEKSIARSRNNFKFQPDLNNRKEVESFRTSIDEISCERSVTKKLVLIEDVEKPSAAFRVNEEFIVLGLASIAVGVFR